MGDKTSSMCLQGHFIGIPTKAFNFIDISSINIFKIERKPDLKTYHADIKCSLSGATLVGMTVKKKIKPTIKTP